MDKIFNTVNKKKIEELFLKWGGVPRFVLEQTFEEVHQKQLEKAIKTCTMKIFDYIVELQKT